MNELFEIIEGETRKQGGISFARFMELALYCPVCGYYEREKDTVGRRGDFFTSVSVGRVFGELLAFQFADWIGEVESPKSEVQKASSEGGRPRSGVRIVEGGAHDGQLARDILNWLRERRPSLFEALEYCIVEPSARRRGSQAETLRAFGGTLHWVQQLSELDPAPQSAIGNPQAGGVHGIIFCNELLDSMPVHRLGWDARARNWFEWGVAAQNGKLVWTRIQTGVQSPKSKVQSSSRKSRMTVHASRFAHDDSSIARLDLSPAFLEVLPDGFTLEFCPAAENWWRDAARVLRRGKLLAIDYGFGANEYFAPERKEGTLRAYYRHHVSHDLLANPGEQDITAHVNFAAIQSVGEAAGLTTGQFTCQEKFLTQIAARFWVEQKNSSDSVTAWNRQFRTLTHPEHLGRQFRALVQSR